MGQAGRSQVADEAGKGTEYDMVFNTLWEFDCFLRHGGVVRAIPFAAFIGAFLRELGCRPIRPA
jgi:hypothetical protein